MDIEKKLNETLNKIRKKTKSIPEIGLILGSGLGGIAEEIEEAVRIPYEKIPYFVTPNVEGHKGQMVFGNLMGKEVCILQGRIHFYEGYSMDEVTYPTKVLASLGIKKLIVTNASGAVNKDFTPGDLVLITDHINLMGVNPLTGRRNRGTHFVDLSNVYDRKLVSIAWDTGKNLGTELRQGVYLALSGPSYETPAEIKMVRFFGADLVGMSTVPEAIIAVSAGLKVLGISCVSNMAAGILERVLDHNEVIEVTKKAGKRFSKLIKEIVRRI